MARANYREMQGPNGHLANRRPFEGHSMSAERVKPGTGFRTGRLNRNDADILWFYIDQSLRKAKALYIVYSYATPIAWGFDGEPAYIVADRFSVTTSKGQNYVRAWINHYATAAA